MCFRANARYYKHHHLYEDVRGRTGSSRYIQRSDNILHSRIVNDNDRNARIPLNDQHQGKDMAAIMGGGDGALGQLPLEQWFFEMPVCTRWWTTATVLTGVLVQCRILTPFQLFYSYRAVFSKSQVRRSQRSSIVREEG